MEVFSKQKSKIIVEQIKPYAAEIVCQIFRHLQHDKSEAQGVSSQQNISVYRLGQHSISVVLAQISLRKINSFAFHFLFSELGMQIWSVTFRQSCFYTF